MSSTASSFCRAPSATIAARSISPSSASASDACPFHGRRRFARHPERPANNRTGVRGAIKHLVHAHGRRRIAFIGGPEGNQDATERYQAYVDALAEEGLRLEPRRVTPGDFSFQSGAAAIATILDQNKLGPEGIDAVVAADDSTALGAMSELGRRNLHVPNQVSVIGFDDVESARASSPPLTTVRQHLREQGAAAAHIMLEHLHGRPGGPLRSLVPTTVVLRRSCGCSGEELPTSKAADGARAGALRFEAHVVLRRQIIRAELMRAAQGKFGAVPGWDEQLIATLATQLKTGSSVFLTTFRSMAKVLLAAQVDPGALAPVLTVLQDQMLSCCSRQYDDMRASIEAVVDQAQAIAASLALESRTRGGNICVRPGERAALPDRERALRRRRPRPTFAPARARAYPRPGSGRS